MSFFSRAQSFVKQQYLSLTIAPAGIFIALFALLLSTGCDMAYYSQAAWGHWQLTRSQVPLNQAQTDSRLNQHQQDNLAKIPQILAFADQQLHLPTQDQYRQLVFLDKEAVTWNVFAAPSLSLSPKTWCFPIAGCLSYRGYFDKQKALEYAQTLTEQGWETYVGPASAYSTLGWFNDPVLSSFLKLDDINLMALLFHELAHQKLYVKDDTTFNESFATAVAHAGVAQWFNQTKMHDAQANQSLLNYQKNSQIQSQFLTLALHTREKLSETYQQDTPKNIKEEQKQQIIEQFKKDYAHQVVHQWEGFKPYGSWMQGPLNNAQWNTIGAYHQLVPAFKQLLLAHDHDFAAFYAHCEALADQTKEQRHEFLHNCANNLSDCLTPTVTSRRTL